MSCYFEEDVRIAQRIPTYPIGGQEYDRVRFGRETSDLESRFLLVQPAENAQCWSCGAARGQFHVPSCDYEQCPRCSAVALQCDCPYDLVDGDARGGDEDAGEEEILGMPEAAAFLGVKERTLRRWLVERGTPHAKIGGLLRFRRSALLAWLQAQERATMQRRRKVSGQSPAGP